MTKKTTDTMDSVDETKYYDELRKKDTVLRISPDVDPEVAMQEIYGLSIQNPELAKNLAGFISKALPKLN